MAASGGAQAVATIQDFTGTGTITYFWAGQQVQGSVTVRAKGVSDFRLDANLPDGIRSWAAIRGKGFTKNASGQLVTIPYYNAVNLAGLTFPVSQIVLALQQSTSTSVTNLGLVQADGHSVYRVRVQESFSQKEDPTGDLARWNTKEFFIDLSTFQIVKTQDIVYSARQYLAGVPREIHFADYRPVNGILVPFSLIETVNGQQSWTMQLNQMTFNTGLQDSDFQL
ncbi:MAG TPA: hypothetical protein VJP02_04335 [Candidatus Sulfotelmatobacter sp.]|nr:hypothetical protein [Candidatus Sulfotelmatobacter sp.]